MRRLHFKKFLDAVMRSFAPQAGFLYAAERRCGIRYGAAVNPDHANLQRIGDPEASRHVTRV
jgi:hypothetical protein